MSSGLEIHFCNAEHLGFHHSERVWIICLIGCHGKNCCCVLSEVCPVGHMRVVEYQEWFPSMLGVFCVTYVLRQKK